MLTRIAVKNFKSLKDVTLKLGRRNTLVGANMAGKSNVIDLLRFIYDMTFPRQPGTSALSSAVFLRGGFDELSWKGGTERTILIELSGITSAHGPEWKWDYGISIQGGLRGNFRVENEWLYVTRPNLPADQLIENTGVERFLSGIQHQRLSSIPDLNRSVLELEFPDWPGNFLRKTIAGWRFYEIVPSLMRVPNSTAATEFLREHGENLSQWLLVLQSRYYDQSFARIQQVLRDALPQVSGLLTSPTQQTTITLGSREKHLDRPVTVEQMSAGELAFIAFLSLIFSPPEHAGSLYCIEDLENYLHPRLIETVLEVLRQSQEEWERKRQLSQIVMTTHSPFVVDRTRLDEIIFVEKKDGATMCTRPADTPSLQKLLQDGEVGLGDLVYSGALSDAGK
jgi:predicted ATPase